MNPISTIPRQLSRVVSARALSTAVATHQPSSSSSPFSVMIRYRVSLLQHNEAMLTPEYDTDSVRLGLAKYPFDRI